MVRKSDRSSGLAGNCCVVSREGHQMGSRRIHLGGPPSERGDNG